MITMIQRSHIPSCTTFRWATMKYRQFTNEAKNDDLVRTRVEEGSKVATLILNRPPVNSLSLEMCAAISKSIKSIETKHPKVQALVLTSSNPSILSAGLDLTEFLDPKLQQRLPLFWNSFQQLFLDLYGSRLAVIGAIEGHAPAAGCMLAMACDYRIMAFDGGSDSGPVGRIGLNEAKFGIAAPPWLGSLMIRTIGFRKAEEALSLGKLYSPNEALQLGLVDRLVGKDSVLDTSYEVATHWAKIPPQARVASKMLARKEHLDDLMSKREQDTEYACNFIRNDAVQAGLKAYLESLKNK